MDEVETLAKALAFEYYVGVTETRTHIGNVNSADALNFYTQHADEYLIKAEKILNLISDSYTTHH
jgi:hypothetical protein